MGYIAGSDMHTRSLSSCSTFVCNGGGSGGGKIKFYNMVSDGAKVATETFCLHLVIWKTGVQLTKQSTRPCLYILANKRPFHLWK